MERKRRELSPWGRQCKAQMILMGKTLDSLSRETSLSRSYISAIINGRSTRVLYSRRVRRTSSPS